MSSNQLEIIANTSGMLRQDILLALLDADGRSARQVARAAGISHTSFNEIRRTGNCIKTETLGRIKDVFQQRFPKLKITHLIDEDLSVERFRRTVLGGGPRRAMKARADV